MQVSSQQMNRNISRQIFKMLFSILADTRNIREVEEMFADLLTDSERMAIAKRLAIGVYLDKGRSYENIKENLKVSSATIAAVAESMGNPGMQRAINMIKAEEWAGVWTDKIMRLVGKMR